VVIDYIVKKELIKNFSYIDLAAFLVIVIGIVRKKGMMVDPGVGWHLLSGKWNWENYRVLDHDIFSWTRNGVEWIQNQWLSDLIFWVFYQIGGLLLLEWLTIVIFSVIIF